MLTDRIICVPKVLETPSISILMVSILTISIAVKFMFDFQKKTDVSRSNFLSELTKALPKIVGGK